MNLWECLPGDVLEDTVGSKMTEAMFGKAYFQRRCDKSYAFGERYTDRLGIRWELVAQNDLCVPYWVKVGRKTRYTSWEGDSQAHKLGALKAIREGKDVPLRVREYFEI